MLDPTGTEVTFVYKNQMTRKLRADRLDVTLLIQQLANPPQSTEYKPLTGDLFPESFPFDYSRIYDYNYFWVKYYMSQRNIVAIPKR